MSDEKRNEPLSPEQLEEKKRISNRVLALADKVAKILGDSSLDSDEVRAALELARRALDTVLLKRFGVIQFHEIVLRSERIALDFS